MKEILKIITNNISPLNDVEWEDFHQIWKPYSCKRKECLSPVGKIEDNLYFITEGLQRIFYEDQEKEATLIFTYPHSFGGILDSFMLRSPSKFAYEALTPSKFLRVNYDDLENLSQKHAGIAKFVRLGITGALGGVLERQVELQTYSSEEKFRKLLQRSPHILQMIPHKYLANYIGIDPTNFSKLMNKIRL
ncbi:Crp/Fnr family transcriptional regulator [Aquiflexum sp.]|uniref:Crp/Fnr family transcriptional regulator n=1 Tax=Aquiflexum sp. TaxID=1872584 RepID=UPI0035933FC7